MKLKNHLISFVGFFCLTGMGIAVLALGGSSGCSSSVSRGASGEGDLSSITVAESEVAAGSDFTPNVSFFVTDENGLGIRALGVDVNSDGTAGTPTLKDVTVAEGDTIALRVKGQTVGDFDDDDDCGEVEEEATPVDIGISLDTTGSMGGASGVLAGKIADFAQFLVDNKVDARFAGVTVGDSFATKRTSGSAYDDSVSTGTLGAPPSDFDNDTERPDTGTSPLEADPMATFFTEVEENIGTGSGGGDFPENYLGALQFLNSQVSWREGATRVLISLGDDCAHTPTSQADDGITSKWAPPDPDDFISDLNSTVPVHVVTDEDKSCSGGTYDMESLADATGGSTTDKGDCTTETDCAVDLTTLPIATSLKEKVIKECDLTVEDLTTITVCLTVQISDGGSTFEGTCCYVLNVVST